MIVEVLKERPADWEDFKVVDCRRDPDWKTVLEQAMVEGRKITATQYPLSHTMRLEHLCSAHGYVMMVHPGQTQEGLCSAYFRRDRRNEPRPGTLNFGSDG